MQEMILRKNSLNLLFFILILTTFFILSSFYSFYTPAYKTADNQFHYNISRLILEEKIDSFDFKHSPLYYYILAGFLSIIDHSESQNDNPRIIDVSKSDAQYPYSNSAYAIHVLRFFSIACGLITIIFSYKIAKIVFPKNPMLWLFSISLIAFLPNFTFGSSVINNDVLVWSLSTISLFYLFKFVNSQKELKLILFSSVFAGLAFLTKVNAVILILVIVTVLTYLLLSKQINTKCFIKKKIIAIIGAITGGYWYYLLQKINKTPSTLDIPNDISINAGINNISNWPEINLRFIDRLWVAVWGEASAHISLKIIGDIFIAIAIVGLFLIFTKKYGKIKFQSNHKVILFSSIIFMALLSAYFMFVAASGVIRNDFPVISSLAVLFSAGLYVFADKRKMRWLLLIPIIFLVITNIYIINLENELYWKPILSYSNNEPFESVLLIYHSRTDLQNAFPEVFKNDFYRVMQWASQYGVKGQEKLFAISPLIDLTNIYYSSTTLQELFPEVKKEHDIKNLLKWALEVGITKYPSLEIHKEYFLEYSNKMNLK